MNARTLNRTARHPAAHAAASTLMLALIAGLAACGGGDSGSTDTTVTQDTAQAMSATAAALPEDSTEAAAATVTTTQLVVAGATAGQTYNCAGGGTASYTATGGTLAGLTNGVLDAGETYRLTFSACRGSAGAATLDGQMSLAVASASGSNITVNTSTTGLAATLPQRVLTLNGSSTIAQTVATAGSTTTTTHQWTSPSIRLTSQRPAGTSTYSMTDVNLTRSVSVSNGLVTGTTNNGTGTFAATLPNGSWSITLASQGALAYDNAGAPTQGSWSITAPNNRITLSIAGGTATLGVDYGADGSIDKTYTVPVATLTAEAG